MADGAAHARALVRQYHRIKALWQHVRLSTPVCDRELSVLHVGDRFTATTTVHLGELKPEEVAVEVYYGRSTPRTASSRATSRPCPSSKASAAAATCTGTTSPAAPRAGTASPRGPSRPARLEDHDPRFVTWATGA